MILKLSSSSLIVNAAQRAPMSGSIGSTSIGKMEPIDSSRSTQPEITLGKPTVVLGQEKKEGTPPVAAKNQLRMPPEKEARRFEQKTSSGCPRRETTPDATGERLRAVGGDGPETLALPKINIHRAPTVNPSHRHRPPPRLRIERRKLISLSLYSIRLWNRCSVSRRLAEMTYR
ncbi:hypothetical protein M569_05274 [Genlisea aurea]|uniref:Uncharacterized protein n=1 Tax=Genlisea aurea TaxID=192259 RepID=S8CWZ1_9LAMI|nr:hypothetical protein M569_05274 [Genlisea aurea]